MNNTMINLLVIIVAAIISAAVSLMQGDNLDVLANILLLAPIVITLLVLIYYDNQFMVYRIGKYLSECLYPQLRSLTDGSVFMWDNWHVRTSQKLAIVAFGRNIFFELIILLPIVLFIFLKANLLHIAPTTSFIDKLQELWNLSLFWENAFLLFLDNVVYILWTLVLG